LIKFHKDGSLPTNNEIFVFGSNLAGIHGAGAAKVAVQKFGATYGIGRGFRGMSYAIPTKDLEIRTLSLSEIKIYVEEFVRMANNPMVLANFFVTRVGCGLAGYQDSDIAPMFKNANNCSFAEDWKIYIQ
jgi:hypothetical protein